MEIEWTSDYTGRWETETSKVVIGGVERSTASMQVSFLTLPDGKLYTKIIVPGTEFPQNTSKTVRLRLSWGAHETHTQSGQTMHTRYVFTPSPATVAAAELRTMSNGSKTVKLTFTGDVISEFDEWTVREIKYNDMYLSAGSTSQRAGNKAYAVWGDLYEADYNHVRSGMTGYIIVEDAAGFHRMNFTIQ